MSQSTNNPDLEFQDLINHPERLDTDEFGALVDRYRDRLSYEDIEQMMLNRFKRRKYGSELERKAAIAVLEGRYDDFHRLKAIMDRRNALRLRVT